jgi:transposase
MTLFTPQLKHHILTQYQPRSRENGFTALARRYNITGGGETVRIWYRHWDGTAGSLERRCGSGRPRLLSRAQVNTLIRTPIRNKNRSHTSVHYTQLLPSVRQKSGTDISLRTLQNYGKRDVEGKGVHTVKITEEQRQPKYSTINAIVVLVFDYSLT